MQIQDRYFDAVTAVLDWDMPEESYAQAVNAQACHLAGSEADDDVWLYDTHRVLH